MLKNRFILCVCASAMVTSWAVSQPDTPDKKLPFAGPPPPEELQVLAPLVGQWTSQSKVGPSLQSKEGGTATGEMTGQWIHNGHFLRLTSMISGAKYREEATVLYSYDSKKKAYRRWLFSSSGLATESEGQWDEGRTTMTWKALNLPQNVTGSIVDIVAKDRVETTVHFKRDDGQVLVDIKVTATPKRQPSK